MRHGSGPDTINGKQDILMKNKLSAVLFAAAALLVCGMRLRGSIAGEPDQRVSDSITTGTEIPRSTARRSTGATASGTTATVTDPIPGVDNIAAILPELKNYSSTDPATVARHVE